MGSLLKMKAKPFETCVLIVEDSYDDLVLMTSVLEEQGLRDCVIAVRDGSQAIDYLEGKSRRAGDKKVGAIILDIDLVRRDGMEVLRFIKSRRELTKLPLVTLSKAEIHADSKECRELGVDAHHIKPVGAQAFKACFATLAIQLMRKLRDQEKSTKKFSGRHRSSC